MEEQEKVMECGVCHRMMSPDLKICPYCGNRFKRVVTSENAYKSCPKCGKKMFKQLDACPNCGYIQTKAFFTTGIIGILFLAGAILWGYHGFRLIGTLPMSIIGIWLIYHSIRDLIQRIPQKSKVHTKDHQE